MKSKWIVLGAVLTVLSTQIVLAQDTPASEQPRKAKMGKLLSMMDTNGDGNIDKSEFLASAEERFNKMDTNSDGVVTQDELKSLHGKLKGTKGGENTFP